VPDPPRFLNVDTIYHDSVMLTWKPPLNDGGGFITQYIVEKLEQGMTNWIRCCTTRYTVYQFRNSDLSNEQGSQTAYEEHIWEENVSYSSPSCTKWTLLAHINWLLGAEFTFMELKGIQELFCVC